MNFLQTCQTFYFSKFHPEVDFKEFVFTVEFESVELMIKNQSNLERIVFDIKGVSKNKKYYGAAIAKVYVRVPDERQVKPVKSGIIYYSPFTLLTPKYSFPFIYVVSVIFIVGLLLMLYNIINDYVFGKIGQYSLMNKISELNKIEGDVFGFDTTEILEDEYYLMKKREKEREVQTEKPGNKQENSPEKAETELRERSIPLEMDL